MINISNHKPINWSQAKNKWLMKQRQVSFDQVVALIAKGEILDILKHPNQKKYANQKILVIKLNNYGYIVPFVETETEYFLKTIIPSRKVTKKYLDAKK